MKAGIVPCHCQQRDIGVEDDPSFRSPTSLRCGPGPEQRGASADGLEDAALCHVWSETDWHGGGHGIGTARQSPGGGGDVGTDVPRWEQVGEGQGRAVEGDAAASPGTSTQDAPSLCPAWAPGAGGAEGGRASTMQTIFLWLFFFSFFFKIEVLFNTF